MIPLAAVPTRQLFVRSFANLNCRLAASNCNCLFTTVAYGNHPDKTGAIEGCELCCL